MNYAGMPPDRSNEHTDECGCVYIWIGPTAYHGTRKVLWRPCESHKKAS